MANLKRWYGYIQDRRIFGRVRGHREDLCPQRRIEIDETRDATYNARWDKLIHFLLNISKRRIENAIQEQGTKTEREG